MVVSNWSSVQGVMWQYYYSYYSDDDDGDDRVVVDMDGIPTIERECDVRMIVIMRRMMKMIVEMGPLVPFRMPMEKSKDGKRFQEEK